MKKKEIKARCYELYQSGGNVAVYSYINNLSETELRSNGVRWKLCNGCDAETPVIENECLCCGAFVTSMAAA
jgi:hypothetical protein